MASVAYLNDYRSARQDNDPVECVCGSVWFELRSHSGGEDRVGAVMLNEDGSVVGRSGVAVCAECGAPAPVA